MMDLQFMWLLFNLCQLGLAHLNFICEPLGWDRTSSIPWTLILLSWCKSTSIVSSKGNKILSAILNILFTLILVMLILQIGTYYIHPLLSPTHKQFFPPFDLSVGLPVIVPSHRSYGHNHSNTVFKFLHVTYMWKAKKLKSVD